MQAPPRREFLKALLFSAGGAAVVALPGCSASADDSSSPDESQPREWTGEIQSATAPARVQPGLRYANTLPTRVPNVRRLHAAAQSTASL
jgi:hypothetical protein